MDVRTLIDHYFGGSRARLQAAIGCSSRSLYRWINDKTIIVHGGRIYLPSSHRVEVPNMPFVERREDFEKMMAEAHPGVDLARVGDHYASEHVQFAWTGWLLAQELATREALG